jgi:hypothetical protein
MSDGAACCCSRVVFNLSQSGTPTPETRRMHQRLSSRWSSVLLYLAAHPEELEIVKIWKSVSAAMKCETYQDVGNQC